jgi:hypothetical protein
MSVWALSKIAHTRLGVVSRIYRWIQCGDSGVKKTETPDDGGRGECVTLIVTESGEQFCSDPLGHQSRAILVAI